MITTNQIETAVRQMRIARRLGKISADVQNRVWRRIARPARRLNWERMMALRNSIEKEITPQLLAKRQTEFEVLDIKYVAPVEKVKGYVPAKKQDETLTPEWWNAAGERDKEATKALRKRIKAEGKAKGLSKEAIKDLIAVAEGEELYA